MALTTEQLQQLRKMIDEEDASEGWGDAVLLALAENHKNEDGSYDLRGAAAGIWEAKTASFVNLVNTQESGSSRSMSQQFDHALAMAKLFAGDDSSSGTDTTTAAPRSTKIVRATREG